MSGTRRSDSFGSPSGELQEIIAAKISLREEIKTELRAEFLAEISKLRELGAVRLDHIKSLIDENRREIVLRAEASDLRYQQRFEAAQLGLKDALAASSLAVAKAETAAEKRFESINEFRGQLADQQKTFMPRTECDTRFEAASERTDLVNAALAAVQLDLRVTMKREDLTIIQADITRLRNRDATGAGKEQVWAIVGTAALSIVGMLLILYNTVSHAPAPAPAPATATIVSPAVIPLQPR